MQKELDRLSNQSRFIQMIIDGALVVSKKKKDVLVAELRKLNFKPFPKASDAKKAGEIEEIVMDDAPEDDSASIDLETEGSAKDFDYLLGMPIWSLTQERVEKLLRQIGDKEVEIDVLIKRTPKELWTEDLDNFLNEWQFQLQDEANRVKKRRAVGRRVSNKLGGAGRGGKRKRKAADSDDSDDDFMAGKKKPAVKSVIDRAKDKSSSTLAKYLIPPASQVTATQESQANSGAGYDDDDFMDIDDVKDGPKVVAIKKKGRTAGAKNKADTKPISTKPAVKHELSDVDDVFAAVEKQAGSRKASDPPARQARNAAKRTKYVDSDSDASNGDDMLGDVSMMVKGIGVDSGDNSGSGSARPLFSNTAARPSSGHGLPRTLSTKKSLADLAADDSDGIDETDYKSLIPQGSPVRPAPRRAGDTIVLDEDSEDSFAIPAPKTKPLSKKPVSKAPLAKAKAKPAAPAVEPKKIVSLSPAAKAYAAKQAAKAASQVSKAPAKKPAGKKKAVESDDEDLANDLILSEDGEPVVRPGRRAAAATAKAKATKYVFSEDDEEDESEESEEDSFAMDDDSD
jgi:DNA topoisomerase II